MEITSKNDHYSKKLHVPKKRATYAKKRRNLQFQLKIHPRLVSILKRIGVPPDTPFTPDPFQIEALAELEKADVLVTAPTGAGKTHIAIKAIEEFHGEGKRSWYASPLKALSNAKYEEFKEIFGNDKVGILTGDRKENPSAPIIVGTTEILRNQLYDTMDRGEDLSIDLVVLDEAHYLGDEDRGVVWEEVLIYLPVKTKLLLLSATIRNAQEICQWLAWLRNTPCQWVAAHDRPVPLFPLFLFPNGELSPLSNKRSLFKKIRTVDPRGFSRGELANIPVLMETLRTANLLPAIFFLKSRADCEKAISMCVSHKSPQGILKNGGQFSTKLKEILKAYPFLRDHQHLGILKKARVGAHHGGQLPHWKLLLEKMMQDGHLEAIFSTSTVAAGVNFPARTVVILQSDRFNGKEFVELSATELLQMTGRAGRRGMDQIGFVLVVPGPHQEPELIHDLLNSPPDPIASQMRVNFSMVLNLLLSHTPEEIRTLFASSLATYQNLNKDAVAVQDFEETQEELNRWLPETACGSLDTMLKIRPQYEVFKSEIRRARKVFKKQAAWLPLRGVLEKGKTFINRKGVPFVAVRDPEFNRGIVEAVRLAYPLHTRKEQVRTYRVRLDRIAELGEKIDPVPSIFNKKRWKALISNFTFRAASARNDGQTSVHSAMLDYSRYDISNAILQKASLPCDECKLFGPCQKSTSHPFSRAIRKYADHQMHFITIQEELWRSFLRHYRFLQEEGYVDGHGRLTADGVWASKLRLDQPLLISEAIRQNLLPTDKPPMLAALIAPFVMDKDRSGDIQLSPLVWKYPDVAQPFFRLLYGLQRLRENLRGSGFDTPPLPFWTVTTMHQWAEGETWDKVREISGMAEGDLAMVILRTADHLRQIAALSETHTDLASCAHKAIQLILREPVLVI